MANIRKRKNTKKFVVEWIDERLGLSKKDFNRKSDASRFANKLNEGKAFKKTHWYWDWSGRWSSRVYYKSLSHYDINIISVIEVIDKKL